MAAPNLLSVSVVGIFFATRLGHFVKSVTARAHCYAVGDSENNTVDKMACGHLPVQNGADVARVCENITTQKRRLHHAERDIFRGEQRRKTGYNVKRIVCIHFGDEPDARVPNLNYTLYIFMRKEMPKELEAIKFGKPAAFKVPEGVDEKRALGILNPSGGVAVVCGYNVVKNTASARSSIGLCQQTSVFFPDLTVREHLVYFGKVVILDEPSAGLDVENKREIWDLLLGMRSKSTLIISTHDMEEADILADRIIVMADGRVLCSGSPAFLKKAYGTDRFIAAYEMHGVGYQLRIVKDPKGLDLSQVLRAVRKAAPKAEADDKMKEAIVSLNTLSHAGFVRMFKELEERGTELGIKAIGVMVATLGDVYIKINLEWVPDGLQPKADYMPNEKDVAIAGSVSGTRPGAARQLGALLTKRAIFFSRSHFLILLVFLTPALVFLLAFDGNRERLLETSVNTRSLPLSMKTLYGDAHAFAQHDVAAKDYFDQYRPLVESEDARLRIFKDATNALLAEAQEDYVAFSQAYLLGGVFEGKRLESWYNPFAPLSHAIGVNLLDTALLRLLTGKHAARIRTTIKVTANPLAGQTEQQKRQMGTVNSMVQMFFGLLSWTFVAPAVVGLLLSDFVIFPFTETASHAKELQLMTGVSGYLYCLSNFFFDLVVYLVAFVPLAVCFVFLYSLETQSYGNKLVNPVAFL
ncbi:ATP-binding cassette sub-family A member 17-like [Ixodes scapularis]|uniref:ATP-binding cassette sub-family A member 17-like n=1 Tax=Ixodes scapularis TaxID=6945 RepID=UPI001A9FF39D|nr:ATP-binding cassette sub-family A member 17-like [Ixodes scapularis]